MSSDPVDKRLANACWAGAGKSSKSVRLPPDESDHSEWAQLAIMQSKWQRGAPKTGLNYSNGGFELEVCNQRCLISGQTTPSILLDGHRLDPGSDNELVCWHSDDDIDYLEVQLVFDDQVTLQRQLILIRDDKVLLLIDSLTSERDCAIDYECTIPIAPGAGYIGGVVFNLDFNNSFIHHPEVFRYRIERIQSVKSMET